MIPTRLPRVSLYSRIAPSEDFDALERLEAETNERVRLQRDAPALQTFRTPIAGDIILAPFAHPNPSGSRFSDGSYGVLYAAHTLATAVAETRYHRDRFLRATAEPEMYLPMSSYRLDAHGAFHDIRGMRTQFKDVYSGSSYARSQPFASELRAKGSIGIVYDSVRHDGGQCVAGFSPLNFSHSRHGRDLLYLWDGNTITDVLYFSARA
ncbi:MAG: RES family NAD+ phosphorylase [Candidatus Eremiobacteraeota bacterium]|nr:RES family NAD+ phosphorylase [Candidatus Eremiobacteraeota bacterium]